MTDSVTAAPSRPGLLSVTAGATRVSALALVTNSSLAANGTLLALAILPYANALRAGFVFDDWAQIWAHPAMRGPLDWAAVLAAPLFPGDLYRPLTVGSFAFDYWLVGRDPWWFHTVNVALHALTTLLVAATARRLFGNAYVAWVAGALFAVHPIHTEAVTGVVGRAEILSAFLGLSAVLAADNAATREVAAARRAWLALSVATFLLALFAKENALLWLPLMLLYRSARRGGPWWLALRAELSRLDWIAWVACIAVYLFLRSLVVGWVSPGEGVHFVDNVLAHVPVTQRILTALAILAEYASQLVFPLVLSADYSYPQIEPVSSFAEPRLWTSAALIGLAALWFWRRPGPVGFAALFPLLSLALTSNVLFPIGTVRADRLLYSPSIGTCWCLALLFHTIAKTSRRPLCHVLLLLLLTGYGLRTWMRNEDWQDQAALFRATVRDAPRSSKAQRNYAVELQRQGQHVAAGTAYLRSWQLYPYEEATAFGLGTAYEKLGQFQEARAWYERAIALNPRHRGAHQNLCRLQVGLGHWAEAETTCRAGLRIAPAESNLWKGLALAWQGLGHEDRARCAFGIAAKLDPTDAVLQRLAAGVAIEGETSAGGGQP